jgi:2-polyprenyl-6-methoxyphenol hydroxylase-like FAD-dependent oxidoreductase
MAQGASMANEDTMVLSQCLSKSISVEKSLNEFFLVRRKRVAVIRNKSNWLGKIGQLESHFFSGLRNFCWKQIPDSWIQKDFEKILI